MKKLACLIFLIPSVAFAQQAGWGNLGKQKEEVFSWAKWWTEPLFSGFWMAWTRATLAFFIVIFALIAVMALLELRRPGGAARVGVFGLETTRGDRLFIGLLGSAYVFIAWLGLIGAPLWVPLGLALAWLGFCFWKV
jgi:predicted small integral membrane protein